MFGEKIKRVEDPALLRGKGKYLDDIHLPGMLHAAFVRAPVAHATFSAIDSSAALAIDGVVAVYTLDDLRPHSDRHCHAGGTALRRAETVGQPVDPCRWRSALCG